MKKGHNAFILTCTASSHRAGHEATGHGGTGRNELVVPVEGVGASNRVVIITVAGVVVEGHGSQVPLVEVVDARHVIHTAVF